VDYPRVGAVGLVANHNAEVGEVRKVENPFKESGPRVKQILEAIKDFCDECPLRLKKCENCYLSMWRLEAERKQ